MQTSVTSSNLFDITLHVLLPLIQLIIPILVSFAILGFFWGVAMYVWNIGRTQKSGDSLVPKVDGKSVMLWGIIALFVFLSIAGIVNLLQATFGISGNQKIIPPSANPCKYNISTSIPCPSGTANQ